MRSDSRYVNEGAERRGTEVHVKGMAGGVKKDLRAKELRYERDLRHIHKALLGGAWMHNGLHMLALKCVQVDQPAYYEMAVYLVYKLS